MKNSGKNIPKKEYSFGSFEVQSFEKVLSDISDSLKMLNVYAVIPMGDSCADWMPADPCMAPPE